MSWPTGRSWTAGEGIPQLGQWITGLAAQRREFACRLADRHSLMIPADDPGYADLTTFNGGGY